LEQKPAPRFENVLGPQEMHSEAPPGEYLPALHSSQVDAAAGATVPAKQSRHLPGPRVLLAWPGTHATQAMVAFSSVWKPAGHGVHSLPETDAVPMGQMMQFRWFCGSGSVPGRHSWQLVAASPASLPSHDVQDPPDRKVPFRHSLQLESPGPEKRPLGQVLHVLA
jgi:hypothetical protein